MSDFTIDKDLDKPIYSEADLSPSTGLDLSPDDEQIIDQIIAEISGSAVPEDYAQHFHLPGLHDQEAHGNWAQGGGEGAGSSSRKSAVTNTPEFKRWFSGSKVVDENGKPLVVYHGGRANQTIFTGEEDKSNYIQGNIFFTDDPSVAAGYAVNNRRWKQGYVYGEELQESDGFYRGYLAIKKPLIVDAKEESWLNIRYGGKTMSIDYVAELARKKGYDGLIVKRVVDQYGLADQYVAFRPEQIKLVLGKTLPPTGRVQALRKLASFEQRELTGPEKRVDFAALKTIFDKDTLVVGEKLRDLMKAARDEALKAFELRADNLTADFANAYRINVTPEFSRVLQDHLFEVWRKNRDFAIAELPSDVQGRLLDLKRYEDEDKFVISKRDNEWCVIEEPDKVRSKHETYAEAAAAFAEIIAKRVVEQFHLPGQHDQDSHGNRAGDDDCCAVINPGSASAVAGAAKQRDGWELQDDKASKIKNGRAAQVEFEPYGITGRYKVRLGTAENRDQLQNTFGKVEDAFDVSEDWLSGKFNFSTYHLPGQHDQEAHGNWAEGGGSPDAPWSQTEDEFYKTAIRRGPGISGILERQKLEALPDSTTLWAFHATDRKTAEKLLAEGVDTAEKPWNLARWRLEHGEEGVEFAPGRGLAPGLSVGSSPQDVSGYGRVILAVRIKKGQLESTPESRLLGYNTGIEAFEVNDAQVQGKIPASDFYLIADNRYPGSAYEELSKLKPKRQFHLPGQHDQESHGNWATGSSDSPGAGSAPHVTDTPEFKRWFSGSKVVDESGKPLVVYHGTGADISEFRPGGAYFSPSAEIASNTAIEVTDPANNRTGNAAVIPVYLSIKNPAILSTDEIEWLGYDSNRIEKLESLGFDGAINEDRTEIFAFYPEQIKSIFNRTFDPKDKRINFAASFKPDVAGNYWRNRALSIKGIVDDELTKQVKMEMYSHIRSGRSARETMGRIRDIFEPWVGDPSKVVPSGISQTPEDVLMPHRIENIVRTETAYAVNAGRWMVAEAADDFIIGFSISALLDERTCFRKGTLIKVGDRKYAPIESIQPGQTIVSGSGKKRKVTAAWRYPAKHWRRLTFADGREVVSTYTHQFWSEDGWREAMGCTPYATRIGAESWQGIERVAMPSVWPDDEALQQYSAQVLLKRMLSPVGGDPSQKDQAVPSLWKTVAKEERNQEEILQRGLLGSSSRCLDGIGLPAVRQEVSSHEEGFETRRPCREVLQPPMLFIAESKSDEKEMLDLQEIVLGSNIERESLYRMLTSLLSPSSAEGSASKVFQAQMYPMPSLGQEISQTVSDDAKRTMVLLEMPPEVERRASGGISVRNLHGADRASKARKGSILLLRLLHAIKRSDDNRVDGSRSSQSDRSQVSGRSKTEQILDRFSNRGEVGSGDGWHLLAQGRDKGEGREEELGYKASGLCVVPIQMRQGEPSYRRFTATHADHTTTPMPSEFLAVISNELLEEVDWAYDLEVEGDHTYIANGLIVHNTEICWGADGASFRLDDPRAIKLSPPLHWQCRSILIYITTNDAPYEWSTEAELDRVVRSIPPEFK